MAKSSGKYREVGDLIRHMRLKVKRTQADLGKAIGVSGSYIGLLEGGHRRPERQLCIDLARAMRYADPNPFLLGYEWAPIENVLCDEPLDHQFEHYQSQLGTLEYEDSFNRIDYETKKTVVDIMKTIDNLRGLVHRLIYKAQPENQVENPVPGNRQHQSKEKS